MIPYPATEIPWPGLYPFQSKAQILDKQLTAPYNRDDKLMRYGNGRITAWLACSFRFCTCG